MAKVTFLGEKSLLSFFSIAVLGRNVQLLKHQPKHPDFHKNQKPLLFFSKKPVWDKYVNLKLPLYKYFIRLFTHQTISLTGLDETLETQKSPVISQDQIVMQMHIQASWQRHQPTYDDDMYK